MRHSSEEWQAQYSHGRGRGSRVSECTQVWLVAVVGMGPALISLLTLLNYRSLNKFTLLMVLCITSVCSGLAMIIARRRRHIEVHQQPWQDGMQVRDRQRDREISGFLEHRLLPI